MDLPDFVNPGLGRILLKKCYGDISIVVYIWDNLVKEFPQMNRTSRLEYADRPFVYVQKFEDMTAFINSYKPGDNWKIWYRGLLISGFTNIDNPETRWNYQKKVFKTLMKFPNKFSLWIRGKMTDEVIPVPNATSYHLEESITLKEYGWRMGFHEGRIRIGYYPSRDTIYIWRKDAE